MDEQSLHLTTDRIILLKISPEILNDAFSIQSEAHQMEVLGISSLEELKKEKDRYEQGLWTFNKKFLYFKLLEKKSKKVMGWCGFHTWYTDHSRAEIGYQLFDEATKQKGYMTEAMTRILEYGFLTMKLHRIEAFLGVDNVPSRRLMDKFNFTHEGLFRQHYFTNNRYEDSLAYSLLQEEYLLRR